MWRFSVILLLATLLGCSSTQRAVRVRCDRHLVPINPPTASDHAVRQPASQPAGYGER